MSAEPYYRGRSDYKTGGRLPPQTYSTTERLQWEAGWQDEHMRNPSPIHISALRNVAFAIQDGRSPTKEDAEALIEIANELQSRRH